MERAYEFRIYPNAAQREQIERTFGCCRWVYNRCLEVKRAEFCAAGKSSSVYELQKLIPVWKKSGAAWLSGADSTALQSSVVDLGRAYDNFFRRVKRGGKPGLPKFKSKRGARQSYRSKRVGDNIAVLDGKHVRLPKLGAVRARVSRPVEGRVLSATVKRVPSGKYFVVLCCTDCPEPAMEPGPVDVMGVDVGVRCLMARSDGAAVENPRSLKGAERRLAREQRRLSRKRKGSANRAKQKRRVATAHERVVDRRKDALHKATTDAVRESQAIAVEKLDVRGMLANAGENRRVPRRVERRVHAAMTDAAMGEMLRQLSYKAGWYGRGFVEVDPALTSETCSDCGAVREMPLTVRVYRCGSCGLSLDRDVNAARNIARIGRKRLEGTVGHTGTGAKAPTLVETA